MSTKPRSDLQKIFMKKFLNVSQIRVDAKAGTRTLLSALVRPQAQSVLSKSVRASGAIFADKSVRAPLRKWHIATNV